MKKVVPIRDGTEDLQTARNNNSGWPPSVESSVRAGLVETMIAIISNPWDDALYEDTRKLVKGYMAKELAWSILINVSEWGDFHERHSLLDKQLKAGVTQLCLKNLYHRVLLFSRLALQLLFALCRHSFLPEKLSPGEVGTVTEWLCTFALQDGDCYADQLIDPAKKWQWEFSSLSLEGPWNKGDETRRLMARHLFEQNQTRALNSVRVLLCMDRTSSPTRLLQVIKQTPTIIDLLLDCMTIEFPRVFPKSTPSSLASEALCALFAWSPDVVPGVSTSTEKVLAAGDIKALKQSMQFLTSQDKWVDRVVQAWMDSEEWSEDSEVVRRSFAATKSLYGAWGSPTKMRAVANIRDGLGRSRISILRLITTLTHCADAAGVKNVDIYPLLAVSYRASFKIGAEEHHRTQDICEWPLWTNLALVHVGYIDPFHVAPERIIGPTAFARLLLILAQRNALNSIQLLQRTPHGLSPTTSLAQLQQMTHPDIIRRFLKISVYRARIYMDKATDMELLGHAKENSPLSSVAFNSTAELAASIVAFVNLTGDVYTGATYRAHFTLGMALASLSQSSLQMRLWKRAYSWALTALEFDKKNAPEEKLSDILVKGCNRAVRESKQALDPQ
ncbi:hypothetical protein CONPUDRAFT_146109 [Coniophora puteana RWD-64-598 SS2]|uniref:Uncharacterized protein n=1 Tax=Coniophora puteana (strain RWD-64-598) TaxID=741705 RepID=A0A5M3MHH9_CONPW|nr:uncharacterized protein CONPUDRAFT_146109 [Coniophora puteana RWD-64-598 SS2]EIW78081.1 hypothetical protein CONPUDRAFT_146109 [Coniophora puteana RWD-64-598 SS2]